jgi:Polysaccharide pyruvyl transferase
MVTIRLLVVTCLLVALSIETTKSSSGDVAVWLLPCEPPQHRIHSERASTVLCAFESCVHALSKHHVHIVRPNLRALTLRTPFERFIRRHALMKLYFMERFPAHVQSLAMLALLLNSNSTRLLESLKLDKIECVSLLGDPLTKRCVRDDDLELEAALYASRLERFAHDGGVGAMPEPLFSSGCASLPERFLTLEYYASTPHGHSCNLGDYVQNFGSLQLVPYVSAFVDRDRGLARHDSGGWLVANAWYGSDSIEWPPAPGINALLVSVHFGPRMRPTIVKHLDYLRAYTRDVGAVGARDTDTLAFLRSVGIESYFSGDLTTMLASVRADDAALRDQYVLVDVAGGRRQQTRRALSRHARGKVILRSAKVTGCKGPSGDDDERGMSTLDYFARAFELIELYANKAKLLMTSRIHAALPAMSQRVPVVFVDAERLPGGDGNRTAGIAPLFLEPSALERGAPGAVATLANPGADLVDRHRAQFLYALYSRSPFYADSARLFGVVPMQRLGSNGERPLHFHFVAEGSAELTSGQVRSIESVLFHEPSALISVHIVGGDGGSTLLPTAIAALADAGYAIRVRRFDAARALQREQHSDDVVKRAAMALAPFLVLHRYGGIYMDSGVVVLRSFESLPRNTLWRGAAARVALLELERGSPFARSVIADYVRRHCNDTCTLTPSLNRAIKVADRSLLLLADNNTFVAHQHSSLRHCIVSNFQENAG